MSARITVHLFRDRHFAPDGDTVVSVAPRDAVVSIYGGGGFMDGDGLSKTFGGNCVFRESETEACFLGVWGTRNASRFRSALRRGGILLEIVRELSPARLVVWSTTAIRPARPLAQRPPDQSTHAEDEPMANAAAITERLILRPWTDADRAPFAALSADPEVMKYLTSLPTRQASDAWIDRQLAHLAEHGFCFWAVASRSSGELVGAVGLLRVKFEAHFTPAVEIGWRIARRFWGLGYAPEAAKAAFGVGFAELGLDEIVAFACVDNVASQSVMAKLGMARDPADDFDYPPLPRGDSLRRQVLYRMTRGDWSDSRGAGPMRIDGR